MLCDIPQQVNVMSQTLTSEMFLNSNPTLESLHLILLDVSEVASPRMSRRWMFAMMRLDARVWLPGRNCSVMFELLKYWGLYCAYSDRVKQRLLRHGVFELGLIASIVPFEGRASTMTVRIRVNIVCWRALVMSVAVREMWQFVNATSMFAYTIIHYNPIGSITTGLVMTHRCTGYIATAIVHIISLCHFYTFVTCSHFYVHR